MLLLVKVVVVEFEIIGTLAVADVGCVGVGVIANGCGFDLPINLVTRLFLLRWYEYYRLHWFCRWGEE